MVIIMTPSLIDQFHLLVFESRCQYGRHSINNTRLKVASENMLYTSNEQTFVLV